MDRGGRIWLCEIKTGDEANVPPVERNWQLRGAALMAARWTGATRVIPAIVFVNAAECAEAVRVGRVYEGRWEVGAPLDAVALDKIEVEIRAVLVRAKGESDGRDLEGKRKGGEEAADGGVHPGSIVGDHEGRGPGFKQVHDEGSDRARGGLRQKETLPLLILGPYCEHCDSRAACPAFAAEAVSLARGRYPYTPEDAGGMALTTAERSYLAGIIPAMRSALDRAEAAVRAGGPVLLADGREYGPALEDVTSFKTAETFDALAAVVGEDEANKAAEYTAAGIKRALEDAPRGAFSALMKDVGARGGLVRGTREVWRKRWPAKSAEVVSDGHASDLRQERGEQAHGAERAPCEPQGSAAPGTRVPVEREAEEPAPGGSGASLSGTRGTCSDCSESFSVTKAGRMRKHLSPGGVFYCGGSGLAPRATATTLAELVEAERGLT